MKRLKLAVKRLKTTLLLLETNTFNSLHAQVNVKMVFYRARTVACCREPLTGHVCFERVREGRLGPAASAEFSCALYGMDLVPW